MPRKKTIEQEKIRLDKIDAQIVEVKNCLGVNLIFNSAFTPEQIQVLENFYKFQVSDDGKTLSRSVINSWKGLVMMLVSVGYCKFGKSVARERLRCSDRSKIKPSWDLLLDFRFDIFIMDSPDFPVLQRQAMTRHPTTVEMFIERSHNKEAFRIKDQAQSEENFKNLLRNRAPDPSFENVAAPETWQPLYMRTKYKPYNIEVHLKYFANWLDLDAKKSTITTEFAKQLPHEYTIYPAIYRG